MGRVREYTCSSCNKVWRVHTGHGMEHAILKNVLDAFPTDIQQKIILDTKEEQFPYFEFNYRPAVCQECQNIIAIPVIHLHQSGHTYSSTCHDCHKAVVIQEEEAKLSCPFCKEIMSLREIGTWD